MPPPTPKDDWIAQFVTYLANDAKPSRGVKFATLIAHQEWPDHKDEPPREAAQRWLKR
jgi:hypothetical protein